MIHIGLEIKSELERQERSVSWFARKLCCERTNVYSIFKRKSIDTDMLTRISRILQHNFFELYDNEVDKQQNCHNLDARPTVTNIQHFCCLTLTFPYYHFTQRRKLLSTP